MATLQALPSTVLLLMDDVLASLQQVNECETLSNARTLLADAVSTIGVAIEHAKQAARESDTGTQTN
jgi:hypothetical protein